jgi:sterol desaturase/sphingolipid hydroxylase (fatty acid hydroxylase superfamily)
MSTQQHTGPAGVTWLVFPALLAAVVGGTIALLARGVPPPAVAGAVLAGGVLVMLGLERLFPLHRAWNAPPDRLDLVLVVANRLVDVAVVVATLALVGRLHGLLPIWPVRAPLVAQAALGLALAEGVRYLLHRLSHRPGLLWRIHRTHHRPRRMYTLNGPRLHPANQLWMAVANAVPMLLLGAELGAVVLAANITVFFVLLQHANLRLRFDGWNRLLATPDVHRLHHARGAARAVNLGIVLLAFDILGGTYRPPAPVAADGIGLDDERAG